MKHILYQECAVFNWDNKTSVTIFRYGHETPSNKDYVYVEVRQYLPDDGKHETLMESTVRVDGYVVLHTVKVIEEPGAYKSDAALVRQGIEQFDSLLLDHPSSHAETVKEYSDDNS